ncbi:hypothetical protein [Cytobacillus purgationiresistens]|uniref:Uncharacterized protein n=1 Tax=Cytobacillus purgationiresistens TaxID=863449 RepID=A0ABU0AGH6_9BACI|nr:hypothetical protein [Cytobacillus purgationiresistens]MDQ0270353.1 hypothetical protein [Cytobacillus purgationiresistens]
MIEETEYLIFVNELGLLFGEYYRCKDEEIKQLVLADILLIGKVIS